MADDYTHSQSALGAEPPPPPPRPPFFHRLWMVFAQPGELFKALALNPAWFPIAVLVALITAAIMWILPAELFLEAAIDRIPPDQAEDAAAQMAQMPDIVFKGFAMGGAALVTFLFPVILSVVTYVIFVFIRGDNSTYRQHVCVVAHTGVITAAGTALNAFVQLRSGDLTRTLSIGTFFPFLSDGYFAEFLLALDLFYLWAAVVAGIGLASAAPGRKAGSTAAVLIGIVVVTALIRAAF